MDWKQVRDVILFSVGLAGILILLAVWIVTTRAPDPSLMLVFSAMAGLPAVMKKDGV